MHRRSVARAVAPWTLVALAAIGGPSRVEAAVIAHWSFDAVVGGNQFTDSTGAYHATISQVGGPPGVSVDAADKVFGAGSANFDRGPSPNQNSGTATNGAAGAYATAPHITGIYTGSHTVASWVKVNNDTTHSGLLGDWSNDGINRRSFLYGFTGGTNGSAGAEKPHLALANTATPAQNGPLNFATNNAASFSKDAWHHVAWVVDRVSVGTTDLRIYVDGALWHSATWTPASGNADIQETTNPTWIGLKEDNGLDFDGKADELWVFSGALSQSAIQSLMNTNAVPEPGSLSLTALGLALTAAAGRRRGV
jgi:hypothetical protein